ncbi:MAG: phospholipase [Candidatus Eremiobacteraeota bacterium]|nr:phospholipase [Candidatus Eremiobacteraeota bacterium]
MAVTVFADPNFAGRSRTLDIGQYRFRTPDDFNDVISSIRVPAGLAAMLFEDADDGGGFGRSVDLLEDCPDLSKYGFNDKTSFVVVFSTVRPGFVWIRNSIQNGTFVNGHWERERASGPPPPNHTAVVSPPLPPHAAAPKPTVIQVTGGRSVITSLGAQTALDASQWDHAGTHQMGVIGSDFRGVEEIGSAAFERASNNPAIPDSFNFWYPQRQPRDHRSIVYFKRTLAGKLKEVRIADITGTYQDFDLNIDITPNAPYQYLIADGHPREYTTIMHAEWTLSAHTHGQPSCDDDASKAEFTFVEAEVQPSADIHGATAQKLNDLILARGGQDICVYGPWIYDKGHCCHAEIHPAEQIWWRDDAGGTQKKYTFSLICDASKRFWWRDQMDDGTKLKPWGAPPIRGIFAIAFEAQLGHPALRFEVSNIDEHNVAAVPNAGQTYDLVYENNVLVSFVPHNDAFKVSYEHVGLAGTDRVRGFLVLETTVGTLRQTATVVTVANPVGPPTTVTIPQGADVNAVDQRYERLAFEKVEGHYIFSVLQTTPPPRRPPFGGTFPGEAVRV